MEQESELAAGPTMKEVLRLFESRGSAWYGGEAVSQLEHALQAAMFAERDSATAELIVAALLHDLSENVAEQGVNDRHEMLAIPWLAKLFSPAVFEPVQMHVAAKRYLCAVDADYMLQLSPASQQSLRLQGGPMSGDEVGEFEGRPFFADAVRLRKWDDAAKVVGSNTPPLDHYGMYVGRVSRVTMP